MVLEIICCLCAVTFYLYLLSLLKVVCHSVDGSMVGASHLARQISYVQLSIKQAKAYTVLEYKSLWVYVGITNQIVPHIIISLSNVQWNPSKADNFEPLSLSIIVGCPL